MNELASWENLYSAYRRAAKGKRGRPAVAAFAHRVEANLLRLQAELLTQTYQPGAYTSFYIHEPKRRLISAAPFRDRVVHHALCQQIEPAFERAFIHDSYANRVGKGTHRALDRAQQFARRYRYVLACDIQQFFPSIDHALLRDALWRKVDNSAHRWLINQILASGAGVLAKAYTMQYFRGDDLFAVERPRGLPIGNLTSQFWANVYLNRFDHFVKRTLRCKGYIRYVDDFLLFGDHKTQLRAWHTALVKRLHTLRLTCHRPAVIRPAEEGLPFLGFLITPERRRLKKRKGLHYQRKLSRLAHACRAGEVPRDQLRASVQGWCNYARYGNTSGLRKAIFNHALKSTLPRGSNGKA
ncbi:MAG: reverse transcriptase domain-containing protein [Bacteroidota bacterium]